MAALNVTMVAFHGKEKPKDLQALILDVIAQIQRHLGQHYTSSFDGYSIFQMHATLIGMEADREDNLLVGRWFKRNRGDARRSVDSRVLQDVVRSFVHGENLFTIRFGGFREARCSCNVGQATAETWNCNSSPAEFHSCDRAPFEGSFYAGGGPVMITGWPVEGPNNLNAFTHELYAFRKAAEAAGLLHKYHNANKPHWRDDDFFIRLGTLSPTNAQQVAPIEDSIRRSLAARTPISIEVRVQDVSIVRYEDASLPVETVRSCVPLATFLDDHSKLDYLYRQ